MIQLFPKKRGNAIIYVIIVLSLISVAIIGFFKIELIFNESARLDLSRKQAELLSQVAYERASEMLKHSEVNNEELLFDENLDENSHIRAKIKQIDAQYFLLEALGENRNSKNRIEAIYLKARTPVLPISDFKDRIYLDYKQQRYLDYNLNQSKPMLYFLEHSTLNLGQKAEVGIEDDVIFLNASKGSLNIVIYSEMFVNGNLEIDGNLTLMDSLTVEGSLILHGDLILEKNSNLILKDKSLIFGKVINSSGETIEEIDNLNIEKIEKNKNQLYFLGFSS